jgi:hypothetical protein
MSRRRNNNRAELFDLDIQSWWCKSPQSPLPAALVDRKRGNV